MKKLLVCSLVLLTASVGYAVSEEKAADKKKEFKATCIVSGKPAKEASSLGFSGGKKIYFCCDNCPNAYKKDRKKFAGKARAQLVQTKQAIAVACALTGRPFNAKQTVTIAGTEVAFCCGNCKGKAEKAEDAVALVFTNAKTFNKGFTLQTKCPVSGKAIDVSKTAEHKKKKVYFCCGNCPKAFAANPEKYTSKLPQFRVRKNRKKKKDS